MLLLLAIAAGLIVLAGARLLIWLEPRGQPPDPARAAAVPVAMLGDSDSQSYQDSIWYPISSGRRGGARHAATLQWTEILARLRPAACDLGEWGVWGSRSSAVRLMDWFGVRSRAPRKEDYRHNFAFAGAHAGELLRGTWRQAPRLVRLMDEDPERWSRGVVVIRIGVVDFGSAPSLDQLARDPENAPARAVMASCLADVSKVLALIRAHHPRTAVVLVGILDNADSPFYFDRWRSRAELDNIRRGLDFFDDGLRSLAAADHRAAFFDDRALFAALWGARDAAGMPAYRTLEVSPALRVKNATGDDPSNTTLVDGHAGIVWNAYWAQELVALMNRAFDLPVPPIGDAELVQFLVQELRLGS